MTTAVETKRLPGLNLDKNLLPGILRGRNEAERFKDWEKAALAEHMSLVWPDRVELPREGAEWLDLVGDECAGWGMYPDGERWVRVLNGKGMTGNENAPTYVVANLENDDDILAVRAIVNETESRESIILATGYVPYGRGDRPIELEDGRRELVLLKTTLQDLSRDGARGLVVVDAHSPAFSWYALKYGMGVLDLTAMPMMINEAGEKGMFDKGDWEVVVGDDGAKEYGQLVSDIRGLPPHTQGSKYRVLVAGEWKTQVVYTENDLRNLEGKSVIMPEDIISTGGTMESVIDTFQKVGVRRVVILATYPIFAYKAVERLINKPGVEIVTTDAYTSKNDLSSANNLTRVKMLRKLRKVLELDQAGLNYWSEEGRVELMELGFCPSPWQVYNRRT